LLKTKAEVLYLAGKRYFVLIRGGKEVSVFTGRQPRQAALKAASRGYTDIRLRERGTNKIHIYKGSRKKVPAPFERPEWMSSTVWKPNVRKIGIQKIEKPKKKAVKKKAKKKKVKKKAKKSKKSKKKSSRKKSTKKRSKRRRR